MAFMRFFFSSFHFHPRNPPPSLPVIQSQRIKIIGDVWRRGEEQEEHENRLVNGLLQTKHQRKEQEEQQQQTKNGCRIRGEGAWGLNYPTMPTGMEASFTYRA